MIRPATDLLAEAALHLADADARLHRHRPFRFKSPIVERCPVCALLCDIAECLKAERSVKR